MVISENSQLGLRFKDEFLKIQFMSIIKKNIEKRISVFGDAIVFLEKEKENLSCVKTNKELNTIYEEYKKQNVIDLGSLSNSKKLMNEITELFKDDIFSDNALTDILQNQNDDFFLICNSVYKASELIRIGENFSARALKNIKRKRCTYLLGKNEMMMFMVCEKAIRGYYFNDLIHDAFEFGLNLETGEFYAPEDCQEKFSTLMQLMVFIELGDIEVVQLDSLRNNGGKKGKDKIVNNSRNKIFVVDSSWNKLIIRTDGFAVRGHFRLQPCGPNHIDRKLIWVDAFEKHGYIRQPKARIEKFQ